MIVLGAGASVPYKFPSGAELNLQLAALGRLDSPQRTARMFDRDFLGWMLFAVARAQSNEKKLIDFLKRVDGRTSVDAFIMDEPAYDAVGRLAIAAVLLQAEERSTPALLGGWYQDFCDALFPAGEGNRITEFSVITFNYDRSLVHFLRKQRVKHTGNQCSADKEVQSVDILPIYGSLGSVFEHGNESVSYGAEEAVSAAADGISLIRRDDPSIEQQDKTAMAREKIRTAGRLVTIGFAFHPKNVELLALSEFSGNGFFCHHKMPGNELENAKRYMRCEGKWSDLDANEFVRAHPVFTHI